MSMRIGTTVLARRRSATDASSMWALPGSSEEMRFVKLSSAEQFATTISVTIGPRSALPAGDRHVSRWGAAASTLDGSRAVIAETPCHYRVGDFDSLRDSVGRS